VVVSHTSAAHPGSGAGNVEELSTRVRELFRYYSGNLTLGVQQ
jgi:hypothetical protein